MILKKTLIALVLISLLLLQINGQDPDPNPQQPKNQTQQPKQQQQTPISHIEIQLDKPYQQQLKKEQSFSAKYRLKISEEKVTQLNRTKWFLFFDVEPTEEFQWEKTKIQLFVINENGTEKPVKQCDTQHGVDSCFLTNNNFDYKKQSIQARVTCYEYCKFNISAEVSTKYQLQPDKAIELDFQDTAYSKLFTLNTNSFYDFKRLQIILKPKTFLSFNGEIRLYANRGESIPTREKSDFKGIHLWDDGLGIFINYPEASGVFTILVEGPEKNLLVLETKLICQSKPIQTTRYEPYFAYLQSQQKQLFQIPITRSQHTFIKLTTLTGSIQLYGVLDQSKNPVKIDFTPLSRSYGQLQYKFQPSFYQTNKDANITDKLFISIRANKDSTFVFESYTNNDEMNYITPEVNRYADLQKGGSDIYYMRLVQMEHDVTEKNKNARVEVMTTTYQNIDLGTRFFLCKAKQAKECQPSKDQIQKLTSNGSIDSQLRRQFKNYTADTSVAGVRYYDIQINYSDFVKTQDVYHIYVIIVILNPSNQEKILYTLQYINLGDTYFLKEKQLKRDRLSIDQIKYYTFAVGNDDDVKAVKIHSTQISGEILMVGYTEDPRYNDVQGKQVYQYHGSVTFLDVKPGQQFFIQVQGIDSAYYSLYLQLIRQSQIPDDSGKSQSQGYNEIVIQQNIPYDFFIKPKEKIIVQMVSTVAQFDLIVSSHLPLDLCLTQDLNKPPFGDNCDITETLTKSERMSIKMDDGLIGNMGVTNNNDKAVQFKVQMRPKKNQPQCTNKPLNYLNKLQIPASNLTSKQIQCFKFNLNRRQNVQIIVQLQNMEYENASISWQLNDKEKEIMMSSRHLLWMKELTKVCGESELNRCELMLMIESNYSTEAKVVVQYLDKDLILLDGMAQPSFVQPSSTQPKNFRYQLFNMVNTTIILQNKLGYYHFYGKIISKQQYFIQNRSTIYPTQQSHLFKSNNPFYYVYQTYMLTQEMIKNQSCKAECILLISVVHDKNNDVSNQRFGRFTIQVSQEDRYLKEGEPIMGYLERGSLGFYEFYNQNKGTIYVQINNQNMNCAKIFIKKGNQTRATPSNHDKAGEQNSLIFEDVQPGPYSIALQATHFACAYTVQAYSSVVKIAKLKRGVFSDKNLQTNETYHFLYEHHRNESFKIMTLNKVGQVMIKMKVLYEGQLSKLLTANGTQDLEKQIADFKYQESHIDFLKVNNSAIYFCTDCTYLISLTANKYTETSVIIPSREVQIPIVSDALIKDQLKQKQVTKFRIFTSNIAQYQLYVQYGKINVTIVESMSGKTVISKVYEQTDKPIYEKINSTAAGDDKQTHYDFIHYSIVTIEGIAKSSFYSFELLQSEDEQKHGGNVKYGIPEYLILSPDETKCFKGTIDDQSQEFILSFDDSDIAEVKNLSIECKVSDKKVPYKTNYGSNEMTLEINDLKLSEPAEYEICLKSTSQLSLTFIQSAHIMMVPSDTSILLTHPTNITFGSKGNTILEIDECSETRSIISVSSSFNNLHTAESEIRQVRRANNLVEFYFWGPVYIHLETTGTRIRWRNKNDINEAGMGYEKFEAGTATAYKEGNSIKIQAKPIQQVVKYGKNATAKVTQINYKIILARNEKQLLNSLNCQQKDVLVSNYQTQSLNSSAIATFQINDDMKAKFNKEKYFLAGVLANLNLEVNGVVENYRFIYPMVDIQREVLYGGNIRPVDIVEDNKPDDHTKRESEAGGLLLIAIGVIVLAIALWFVYKKWVKRWLRSRRQRLSEQGSSSFKYTEFASMDA